LAGGSAVGYGLRNDAACDSRSYLTIRPRRRAGDPACHWCFRAPDSAAVRAFHAAGLAHGGRDGGAPGAAAALPRPYYAAFLLDPDGNRIEAVCHRAEPPLDPAGRLAPPPDRGDAGGAVARHVPADRADAGRPRSRSPSPATRGSPRRTPSGCARCTVSTSHHGALRRLGGGLLRGEFGYSRLFAQPVATVIAPALLSTLVLLGCALALSAVVGIALGLLAAARPGARPAVDTVAILGQSAPSFWLGILLIILFAVTLGWLPAGGASETGGLDALRFLVLPVATLAIANLAAYARHSAAALSATLREPWMRAARARGNAEPRLMLRHALPNAAVPILQIAALDAGALVGGALITETLFARPGMGKLIYDAVMGNDTNLALVALLLVALVTMLATLGSPDLAQRALDPRLRIASTGRAPASPSPRCSLGPRRRPPRPLAQAGSATTLLRPTLFQAATPPGVAAHRSAPTISCRDLLLAACTGRASRSRSGSPTALAATAARHAASVLLAAWRGRAVDCRADALADGHARAARPAVLSCSPRRPIPGAIGLPRGEAASDILRIVAILAIFGWVGVARLARAAALSVLAQDYVRAARALGASEARVLLRHVVPNIAGPVAVATALAVAGAILAESTLSFLGLGIAPPAASWGNMLSNAQELVFSAPWAAVWPGLAILLAVAGCTLVADGLRR
jgi:peptide/nickel transport system permease protein